jgi:cell division protein FtsQ
VAAVIAVIAALIGAGLVAATHTAIFSAEAIRVRGANHLTKGDVLRLSGLERGVNVFHLDPGSVADRIERDPWVARATVTKDLPSTLILTIRERFPVAVVNDGSVERLVGDDGGLLDVGAPSTLPRIVADDGATTSDPEAVSAAARAVSAMRPEIRRLIELIVLLPAGDLALELRSGIRVTYGDAAAESTSKAQALAAMLRYAERKGARFTSIDVSAPTAPAGGLVAG